MDSKIEKFQADGGETIEALAEAAKITPKDKAVALATAPSAFYRAILQAKKIESLPSAWPTAYEEAGQF